MATRGPARQVSDEEILDCFYEVEKPFVTTADVAERVELSRTRIRQRIESMNTAQRIERRKVGNAVVYWLSEDRSASR